MIGSDLLNAQFIEAERRRRRSAFLTLFADSGPLCRVLYPKHLEFFAAGAYSKERLFMAANRAVTNHDEQRRPASLDLVSSCSGQFLVEDSRVHPLEGVGGTCIAKREHPQHGQRFPLL